MLHDGKTKSADEFCDRTYKRYKKAVDPVQDRIYPVTGRKRDLNGGCLQIKETGETTMISRFEELNQAADLDRLISRMLEDSDPALKFVHECDKQFVKELEQLISKLTHKSDIEVSMVIENEACNLLDSVCDANRVYFRNGMKTGLFLFLQMIGL